LEFVINEKTGLIAEPSPRGLAAALDTLWENRAQARMLGEAGRRHYNGFDINWDNVVKKLLA
jgi:glycosyltransferase involved in cell wall biosynthesis